MKKIGLYLVLTFLYAGNLVAQSGKWGFCVNNYIYNNHNFNAGRQSSIRVDISVNGAQAYPIMDYQSLEGLSRYSSTTRDSRIETFELSQRVVDFGVYTKLDKSGGGDPDNGWRGGIPLQSRSESIGYKKYIYTNSQVYRSFEGTLEIYAFPKDLNIVYKSGTSQVLPTLDKVQMEAPSGYTSDTYKWVYSTDNGSTWHEISNTALPLVL